MSKYQDLKIPTADEALNTIWENSDGVIPNKKTAGKYAGMGVDYITANGKVY